MAEWLRLPSGHALNMDRYAKMRSVGDNEVTLVAADGYTVAVNGADAAAVRAYLDRVHVGERTADERPPRGRDNVITKG